MPVTMIEPEGGMERWGEYLVSLPGSHLAALDRPCCAPSERISGTGAATAGDVTVNAEHLADHEFAGVDDEAVAQALVDAGATSKGDVDDEMSDLEGEVDAELAGRLIRPHLAEFELRRRGYSPGQVSRLQSSDWSVLGEGPGG